jgi:hypothetical protein
MSDGTSGTDMAAITETVRAYYDGMLAGDALMLGRAFHPRASIVGNWEGALYWKSVAEFAEECKGLVANAGPAEWRIETLSIMGDMALVRLGNRYAGVWYTDDLSLVKSDGAWRIVHKTFHPHPG